MGTRDPRVDEYIAKSAEFARPILTHLREVVHAACPEVVETMKWSMPSFTYHGILCGMAAFKHHAVFGFWKGALIEGVSPNLSGGGESMGNFGRLTSMKDLPSKTVLVKLVKQAMTLNEEGVAVPRARKVPKAEPKVPPELAAALTKHRKAKEVFDGFSPSHRREYVEWITEAKREETRAKRVAQTIAWLAEGKRRNWKYE